MKNLAVVATLGLLAVILFWDVIVGGNWLIDGNPGLYDPWRSYSPGSDHSKNTLEADSFLQYYPFSVYLHRSLLAGRFPLWNPEIFAGMPFFADPQTRVVYPVRLLLLAAHPARAMGYDVALHVFLAMLGMYLFLRSLKLKTWGALLGACSYGFSSYFYVRYGHPTLVGSAAWLPFFFYGLETALRREVLGTVLLTVSLAMGYLAGFPQVFLFGVLALVVYGFYLAVDRPSGQRWSAVLKTTRIIGISGVFSVLLVSVQLLPFWELFRNSVGLHYDYQYIRRFLLIPPALLLRSVFPTFFGQPTGGTDWSGLVRHAIHPYNPEYAVYCGIGALLAALAGLLLLRKSARVRMLLGLLVLGVVFAVVPPATRLGYAVFPMFRASRVSRVAVIPCFALSTLAAIGLSTILSNPHPAFRKRLVVIAACVSAFAVLFAVCFQFAGESVVERLAQKARAVPDHVWAETHMYVRSDKIREWAQEDTGAWLAYEKRALARGILVVLVSSAVFTLLAVPAAAKPRLKAAFTTLFVLVVMCDLVTTARIYRISQTPDSAWETAGIRFLKQVIGDQGRWRTKPFQPRVGDRMPFPPNTNQLFGLHSLQGSHTINTRSLDRYRSVYVESKRLTGADQELIKTVGTGVTWLANSLDDLMSVRYVIAEKGESRYASSSILRSILDRETVSAQIRMVNLNGESNLALCQEAGQRVHFKAVLLPVDFLHFCVGFDSQPGAYGDSVFFLLACESQTGRITFVRGLDQGLDKGRWHQARLDISALKGRMVDIIVSVVASNASSLEFAGWSGFEFALGDCPTSPTADGYAVSLPHGGRTFSLQLTSDAREVPLTIFYDDGGFTRRQFCFPPGITSRRVRIDLARTPGKHLFMRSDSTYRITDCRQIPREWGIDLDCHLIYDGDMCIYENSRAISKGICLDRERVSLGQRKGSVVLELGRFEDIHSVECGWCRMVSYAPEKVVLEAQSDRACYLLFQDMYYPGWKAYVNGRETGFVDTDIGIRAVELSPGRHLVVMRFGPRSFTAGIALSCLGVLCTLVYAIALGRRPTRKSGPPGLK
jgi:hypothetical protein